MGELGEVSFRIYKLGELGEVSFGMLKLGELGELSFGIYMLGELDKVSFGILKFEHYRSSNQNEWISAPSNLHISAPIKLQEMET